MSQNEYIFPPTIDINSSELKNTIIDVITNSNHELKICDKEDDIGVVITMQQYRFLLDCIDSEEDDNDSIIVDQRLKDQSGTLSFEDLKKGIDND